MYIYMYIYIYIYTCKCVDVGNPNENTLAGDERRTQHQRGQSRTASKADAADAAVQRRKGCDLLERILIEIPL